MQIQFKTRGLQLINFRQGSRNMSKKSLQTRAKQALADYQKEEDYLTLRTRQQLQLIRRAVVHQIAKKDPQADLYKGLQDNVDRQIEFRKQKASREEKLADRYIQIRKAASEITRAQLIWTTFVSVVVGGILAYLKGLDSGGWPWWGYFLVGLIATLIIGLTIVILYNYKCAQKLEDQEAKRLQEKSQVNMNERLGELKFQNSYQNSIFQ